MFPFGHAALVGPGSQSKAYHLPPMVLRVPAARAQSPAEQKKKKAAREKETAVALHELVASEAQLRENGFPLAEGAGEGEEAAHGLPPFVATRENVCGVELAAIDCEMVTTAAGLELGRVSVVTNDLRVLLDTFVAPRNPIADYNTRYSGLTEEALRGAPPLETVREQILQLIGANSVLAGHSLENDLQCLRLVHRRVADTSLLFPHTRGGSYKRALRDLAATYLGESIQEGEHCSVQVRGERRKRREEKRREEKKRRRTNSLLDLTPCRTRRWRCGCCS